MRKLSPIEFERTKTLKIARTLIRLKHSVAADEELNDRLPELASQFDDAVQSGELKRLLNPEDILRDV